MVINGNVMKVDAYALFAHFVKNLLMGFADLTKLQTKRPNLAKHLPQFLLIPRTKQKPSLLKSGKKHHAELWIPY